MLASQPMVASSPFLPAAPNSSHSILLTLFRKHRYRPRRKEHLHSRQSLTLLQHIQRHLCSDTHTRVWIGFLGIRDQVKGRIREGDIPAAQGALYRHVWQNLVVEIPNGYLRRVYIYHYNSLPPSEIRNLGR